MKLQYVTPRISAEEFEANQYVAACLEATVQCAYPGSSPSACDDGTSTYKDSQGMWHGICGADAPVTISSSGTGYEVINGVVQKNRPISGVNVPEQVGEYWGSWTSTDGSGNYTHYGRIRVTYVDSSHPNHS